MVERVLLASPRGYCAGVERAVETVEKALEHYGAPVYVRKQIVHNIHVVRDLEARGAIFVDEETEVPAGATVVYSAHGVAPTVHANSAAAAAQRDRRDLPARHEGARAGPPLRGRRLHGDPDRPRGPRGGRRDDGRGARGDDPRPGRRRGGGARPAGRRARRLHHPDDALGRRDLRDHRRAPPALSADLRAAQGRHLLRDLQPAVGGEGDARRDRPPARARLEELLELEPARRRRARLGGRRAPDRRRDGDRRALARRRPHGRDLLGRVGARAPRRPGSATGSATAASSGSSRSRWSPRTSRSSFRSSSGAS